MEVTGKKNTSNNSIRGTLARAVARFEQCGLDEPRANAEFLLGHFLNMKRHQLYLSPSGTLNAEQIAAFDEYMERRCKREPAQYIAGTAGFYGLEFKVTPDVLIPRPETELLVEVAVTLAKKPGISEKVPLIVDLCTGSGCVALSLAIELKEARVLATDVSPAALTVARENARLHNVVERVEFLEGDLFGALDNAGIKDRVDMVLSNPPYVSIEEFQELPPEIREFEPTAALKAGDDGMDFIRRIVKDAPEYLTQGGDLLMETGFAQARISAGLLEADGRYEDVTVVKDLSGIERVVRGRLGVEVRT